MAEPPILSSQLFKRFHLQGALDFHCGYFFLNFLFLPAEGGWLEVAAPKAEVRKKRTEKGTGGVALSSPRGCE